MPELMTYEKQLLPRSCGAAALCMVYRALGLSGDQAAIHAAVSQGAAGARTHQLARHAMAHGLTAVILQARHPWAVLLACQTSAVPALVHHRAACGTSAGHYSVLAGVGTDHIVLDDPLRGPGQVLNRDVFLPLWAPAWPVGEVPGYILLAIDRARPAGSCPVCGTALPLAVSCRGCRHTIPLALPGILGCLESVCPGRLWHRLFCPWCDRASC